MILRGSSPGKRLLPNDVAIFNGIKGGFQMIKQSKSKLGRREFLGTAALAGFIIIKPVVVQNSSALEIERLNEVGRRSLLLPS